MPIEKCAGNIVEFPVPVQDKVTTICYFKTISPHLKLLPLRMPYSFNETASVFHHGTTCDNTCCQELLMFIFVTCNHDRKCCDL